MMAISNVECLNFCLKEFFQLLTNFTRAFPYHMSNLYDAFFNSVIQKSRVTLHNLCN